MCLLESYKKKEGKKQKTKQNKNKTVHKIQILQILRARSLYKITEHAFNTRLKNFVKIEL